MCFSKGGPHDRDASPDGRRIAAARLQPAHEQGVPWLGGAVCSTLPSIAGAVGKRAGACLSGYFACGGQTVARDVGSSLLCSEVLLCPRPEPPVRGRKPT